MKSQKNQALYFQRFTNCAIWLKFTHICPSPKMWVHLMSPDADLLHTKPRSDPDGIWTRDTDSAVWALKAIYILILADFNFWMTRWNKLNFSLHLRYKQVSLTRDEVQMLRISYLSDLLTAKSMRYLHSPSAPSLSRPRPPRPLWPRLLLWATLLISQQLVFHGPKSKNDWISFLPLLFIFFWAGARTHFLCSGRGRRGARLLLTTVLPGGSGTETYAQIINPKILKHNHYHIIIMIVKS